MIQKYCRAVADELEDMEDDAVVGARREAMARELRFRRWRDRLRARAEELAAEVVVTHDNVLHHTNRCVVVLRLLRAAGKVESWRRDAWATAGWAGVG